MSRTLFISYSRADMVETDWLSRLKMYLAPLRRSGLIDVWDDNRIKPGDDWRAEIDKALRRAGAAVFLVGPGFLASDFVMECELPRLLESAKQGGTKIFPLIVGYCGYEATDLGRYQALNRPEGPLEGLPRADQNRILNELAIAVDQTLRSSPDNHLHEGALLAQTPHDALHEIGRLLQDTGTAFNAQCRRRDGLVAMLEQRLRIKNDLEYEKFFFQYFPQLSDAERFEFDQIRAITEGSLYNGNRRIAELLEQFPNLMDEVPELMALRQHLVFWLNKFDRVFLNNKAMCLLYAGVEDGVPFPFTVGQVVAKRLRQS